MKQAILNFMLAGGAFAPFRFANRGKLVILTYHRFSERDEGPMKTSARQFAAQLDYLAAHYTIVPLSLVAERLARGENLPPRAAVITIDDGYRDAYTIAFPILRRRNLPTTLFVATEFVDRRIWLWTDKLRYLTARTDAAQLAADIGGQTLRCELGGADSRLAAATRINAALKSLPDGEKDAALSAIAVTLGVPLPELPPAEFGPLTWDEARELDAAGIHIGSHTRTHPILTNVTDENLRRELRESKARLEDMLNRGVELFCYPNGDTDARVRGEVERANYKCAVTTLPGLNDGRSDPLSLSRVPAENDLAHFAQATSGFDQLKDKLRPTRPKAASVLAYE
ncbi:MAG: polysaccharide deacetylase family protein [Pyrinomonadaceae bacterium]